MLYAFIIVAVATKTSSLLQWIIYLFIFKGNEELEVYKALSDTKHVALN